jgi:2-oxo-4-hydroxy-4-carboxy-5-ureidoimidazoline decarboxylase
LWHPIPWRGYSGGRDLEIMACVTGPKELSIAELNELPEAQARQALASCCPAVAWIEKIVSGRSYSSVDALLARSDEAVAGLTVAQLSEALAGHPRIGERGAESAGPAGSAVSVGSAVSADWSRQEQAGVSAADAGLARDLAEGNAEYERRFGHIYLVCATGKSGQELLAILRERLDHDDDIEWKVVAAELAKINQLRLRKLLGGAS